MIALASASAPESNVRACSVRAFVQDGEYCGAWLEWDGSILKPRSVNTRGLEIDFPVMLQQLKSGLESTPIYFKSPKVKAMALMPRVRKCEAALRKVLRDSGLFPELSAVELNCISRSEFDRFNQFLVPGGYPAVQENPSATSLILLPQNEQIAAIVHAHILELIRISTGRITLIG